MVSTEDLKNLLKEYRAAGLMEVVSVSTSVSTTSLQVVSRFNSLKPGVEYRLVDFDERRGLQKPAGESKLRWDET